MEREGSYETDVRDRLISSMRKTPRPPSRWAGENWTVTANDRGCCWVHKPGSSAMDRCGTKEWEQIKKHTGYRAPEMRGKSGKTVQILARKFGQPVESIAPERCLKPELSLPGVCNVPLTKQKWTLAWPGWVGGVTIWLLGGVSEVVVREKHEADTLGAQSQRANHLRSLTAGNGTLLLGTRVGGFSYSRKSRSEWGPNLEPARWEWTACDSGK